MLFHRRTYILFNENFLHDAVVLSDYIYAIGFLSDSCYGIVDILRLVIVRYVCYLCIGSEFFFIFAPLFVQ